MASISGLWAKCRLYKYESFTHIFLLGYQSSNKNTYLPKQFKSFSNHSLTAKLKSSNKPHGVFACSCNIVFAGIFAILDDYPREYPLESRLLTSVNEHNNSQLPTAFIVMFV